MLSSKETGNFCHGDSPTMADCCLIPQAIARQTCTTVIAHFGVSMAARPVTQSLKLRLSLTCLQPQVWNALHRYGIHMPDYPIINGIYERCMQLPAFVDAMPEKQADYTPPKG